MPGFKFREWQAVPNLLKVVMKEQNRKLFLEKGVENEKAVEKLIRKGILSLLRASSKNICVLGVTSRRNLQKTYYRAREFS